MAELFECFPYLKSEMLIIRKMTADDIDSLAEITNNDNVYKYIPPFLHKKSRGNLIAAIRNLGGREFDKKRSIVAGIYLCDEPEKLIGLAEMFDYKKRANQMTIGYRINELYWNRGIATETAKLITDYLCNRTGVKTLKAYVMPENIFSERVLIKNGFKKEVNTVQDSNWGGRETVELNVFTYSSYLS